MKILEMHLMAYGPFTDNKIDFSAGSCGLHFVYGPNEAGKSSALRALRHSLYGIPQRCEDDFLHPYNKMRVGAKICSPKNETLLFLRRKGRSNTLRSMDDKTIIDDLQLDRFLNGVDVDLFTTLFGIDYMELTRGGEEIIAGGGSLGKLLFSAGSGIADLGQIQKDLQDQADALFKRAAQKPVINATISHIDTNKKALRDAQLPSHKWKEHDQLLQDAMARMKQVDQTLLENQRQLHRLERIAAALPIITRRRELLTEFQTVANAIVLPSDFSSKRQQWTTDLKVAVSSHEQFRQRKEQLAHEIAQQKIPDEILAVAGEIDAYYRELGSLQKAAKDRLQLKTRHSTLMAEIKDILMRLRPGLSLEAVEQLRIKKADMVAIQELGAEYERLTTRLDSIREERLRLSYLLTASEKQSAHASQPRDISALKNAVDQAEEHVTHESYCREEHAKVNLTVKSIETQIAKMGLWNGTPEQLERLQVPSLDTISMFESRLEGLHHKEEELKTRHQNLLAHKEDLLTQIRALRMERRVPTPKQLDEARAVRAEGWRLLRLILKNKTPDENQVQQFVERFPQAGSLVNAYETAVLAADQLADRLRHEAESVALLAKLSSEEKTIAVQLQNLERELSVLKTSHSDALKEWDALWRSAKIVPLSPREMRTWVQHQKSLAEKATDLRERFTHLNRLAAGIARHCQLMDQCLNDLGEIFHVPPESLLARIKRSRHIIQKEETYQAELDRQKAEKRSRREELGIIQAKERQTEADLSRWKTQWGKAMQILGLDENALPRQAGVVIEENKKLFDTHKEAHILHQRMQGIDRDEEKFAIKVQQLVRRVAAGELSQLPAHEAVMTLNQRLSQARMIQSSQQKQAKELEEMQHRSSRSAEKIAAINAHLDLLCEQAACKHYDELPAAEMRSEKRCRIEAELTMVDQDLRKLSAGMDIVKFTTEVLEIDPDSISGKIKALQDAIAAMNSEKEALNQTIGRERNELSRMDGSARAADLAEEIQLLMGRLHMDTEQYARLKLAAVVLEGAMERFRDRNQGPLLTNASRIFAQLTCGSFEGVRADYDNKGDPVLVGVRSNTKEIVGVQGMSDGTADQLYLSLRLAGLLDYMKRNEPMPFVVDDILIQFDDRRATAALQALADLSEKTQVIFFTHHQHLLELAKKAISDDVLIPHFL